MSEERVRSELFIGREPELAHFKKLLKPEAKANILNIHTNGGGGIGKTQLLLRMQKHCASVPDNIVFSQELIDFYQVKTHSKLGLLQQIGDNLVPEKFPEFRGLVKKLRKTQDISEIEDILSKLQETFKNEYGIFASEVKAKGKIIVLFFDTYEVIQGTEITVNDLKHKESTEFSRWVETQLFPAIAQNSLLVVSGRYPLKDINRSDISVKERKLEHFVFSETVKFWNEFFFNAASENENKLVEKLELDSKDSIRTLHNLADGRPILLALFADWVNYDRNRLSPEDLLNEIQQDTKEITDPTTSQQKQKELFERRLIERVSSLIKPEDRTMTYMAIAYHRMTPEMLADLLDLSLEESREILLVKLKPLSFIKYKTGDVVLLHDEMRRLILQLWWNAQDSERTIRKDISTKLVRYYEEQLLKQERLTEEDQEIYTSELLEYAFLADPLDGLNRFCNEFDIAMEDGEYDYANLLLHEAESYQRDNPDDLPLHLDNKPFRGSPRILLRRIRHYTETDKDYKKSLEMANEMLHRYEGDETWKESDTRGYLLYQKGITEFWLRKFEESRGSFREAKNIFLDSGDKVLLYRANNWIGLADFRQGDFSEPKRLWLQAQKGFLELLKGSKKLEFRQLRRLFQGFQHSFGNLAINYRHTGQFAAAIRHAEIQISIVRHLPRNSKEILRSRITTTNVHQFAGRMIDARHHAEEAERLIDQQQIWDRLLIGRLKINLCLLQYHTKELTYLLEYYRAEEIENIVENQEFVRQQDITTARTLLKQGIDILRQKPEIVKELADAYYALGELLMVTPSTASEEAPWAHWEKAEKTLFEALKWGKASQFRYRVIDTIESLIALYYFWNGSEGVPPEMKAKNQEKITTYQKEMQPSDYDTYPNLYGKYEITLGDMDFDSGLEYLGEERIETLIECLKKAFEHYVTAVGLMQKFNQDRYYFALRIFYNRLNTLFEKAQEKNILSTLSPRLNELQSMWQKEDVFEEIYQRARLRIQPEQHLSEIDTLHQENVQNAEEKGEFGLATLLNDCLIGAYTSLSSLYPNNDAYKEQRILQLTRQSDLYRILGDEYQATRCLRESRDILPSIQDAHLKEALEGVIDSREGTLNYRRGEYGRLLEFYLQDELKIGREQFDSQFPDARQKARHLLLRGEKKIQNSLDFWEERRKQSHDNAERMHFEQLITRHRRNLARTRFRIGVLFMLNEEFKEALSYLQQMIINVERNEE